MGGIAVVGGILSEMSDFFRGLRRFQPAFSSVNPRRVVPNITQSCCGLLGGLAAQRRKGISMSVSHSEGAGGRDGESGGLQAVRGREFAPHVLVQIQGDGGEASRKRILGGVGDEPPPQVAPVFTARRDLCVRAV